MKTAACRLNSLISYYEAGKRVPVVRSHPSRLSFMMIDKCNSKCVMCGGNYAASTSGKMMTLEKYSKILSHLEMKKVDWITFGGAGEPLLNPHLAEIADYTAKEYKHVKKILITNGINLDEKMARLLLGKIDTITFSLNAATRETYFKIMQVDRFDQVCENIARFVKLKNQMGCQLKIDLSIIISRITIEELIPFVELAKRLGNLGVMILYCRFYPEQLRFKAYDTPNNRLTEQDSLFFHKELANEHVTKARQLVKKYHLDFYGEPLFGEKFIPKPCTYPWEELYIGFDGEIYPCAAGEVLFKDKVEKGIYKSGNLLKEKISDIWNNEFFVNLRKTNSCGGEPFFIKECACCGNKINWLGPDNLRCHILDWSEVLSG